MPILSREKGKWRQVKFPQKSLYDGMGLFQLNWITSPFSDVDREWIAIAMPAQMSCSVNATGPLWVSKQLKYMTPSSN